MSDPKKVVFAIKIEDVQVYCDVRCHPRLTEDELQNLEDAFAYLDCSDLIDEAIEIAVNHGGVSAPHRDLL